MSLLYNLPSVLLAGSLLFYSCAVLEMLAVQILGEFRALEEF